MRLTFLGHDGLRIGPASGEGGEAVLVDPWLHPAGAFAGAWFPYPPATPCGDDEAWRQRCLEGVATLVVTQALPEHLDPWVLAALPATVPVLVVRTPSSELAAAVRAVASEQGDGQPQERREVVELEPWQWYAPAALGGDLRVALVPEVSARHAAAVVVQERSSGHALVHLGEARMTALHARCIRRFLGAETSPAVVTLRTNVAGYTPLRTAADEQRRFLRARQARRDRQEAAITLLRILKPQAALLAGPSVCLLDETLAPLQAELDGGPATDVHAEGETFHRRFVKQLRAWQRGDEVDLARPEHTETHGRLPVPESLDAYAASKAAVLAQQVAAVASPAEVAKDEAALWEAVQGWFGALLESCRPLRRRINLRLYLEATDATTGDTLGRYRMDFRERARILRLTETPSGSEDEEESAVEDGPSDDATLRAPVPWLHAVLSGRSDFATLLHSLRFRFDSEASRMRLEQLLELLQLAGKEPATAGPRAQARVAATQWLPVPETQGESDAPYWIGRHCPHAQVDLLTCGDLLDDGTLRCLAHSYDFALSRGGHCLNAPECSALPVYTNPPPPSEAT